MPTPVVKTQAPVARAADPPLPNPSDSAAKIPLTRFQMKQGFAVAFGDVLLGKPTHDMPNGATGVFRLETPRLWSNAVIRYAIDSHIQHPERIEQALQHMADNSPLKFELATDNNADAIVFQQSEELCGSYMGALGGLQPILLADHCTWTDVVHEVMHAIGFPHEHSRADRDQFVRVLFNNIQEDFLPQFDIAPTPVLDVLTTTGFDYQSVMIYPKTAFAKTPNLETLQSLNPAFDIAPSQQGLSNLDKERLFRLFSNR
jgi:hypothetical protein